MDQIPDGFSRRQARKGERAIALAEAIMPGPSEPIPRERPEHTIQLAQELTTEYVSPAESHHGEEEEAADQEEVNSPER